MPTQIPNHIIKALEQTGLPYEIVPKRKHQFIKICGHVVLTVPNSTWKNAGRSVQNNLATIKRAARVLKGCKT